MRLAFVLALVPSSLVAASCAGDAGRGPASPLTAASARNVVPAAPAAAASDCDTLALGEVVALALRAHPALAEAAATADAAAGRAVQAGLWPNPRVGVEARDVPRHPVAVDRGGRWVTLRQALPLGGRLGDARRAAEAERGALEADAEDGRRRVVADARRACADLVAAEAVLAVRAAAADVARDRAERLRRAADEGFAAAADAAEASIAAERVRAAHRRAERDVVAARAALRALLGGAAPRLDHVVWTGDAAAPEPFDDPESHPRLRAAALRVAAAEAHADEARAARVPEVEASVAYGRVGEDSDEQVEAGLSVPIPLFDRNQGRVRETEADARAARAAETRVRVELAARREAAVAELAAASVDVAAHRDRIVPETARLLARAEDAARDGTRSADEVARARLAHADAELARIAAERALRRAEAELIEVGRGLPRVPSEETR